jgi:hypothetical protein
MSVIRYIKVTAVKNKYSVKNTAIGQRFDRIAVI